MARTLIFGDIHGCVTAFETVLSRTAPDPEDQLIFLGDYVDRGPDSKGVVDRLIALDASFDCVFLEGNHEEMMLAAIQGQEDPASWLMFGGDATLWSYAPEGRRIRLGDVSREHIAFLSDLDAYHEAEEHIYVHACVDPDLPLEEHDRRTLRWKKLYTAEPHSSGKMVVCGHTAQASGLPLDFGHTLCIDTHVYGERGWLSCLDLDGMFVNQGNEAGVFRSIARADFLQA